MCDSFRKRRRNDSDRRSSRDESARPRNAPRRKRRSVSPERRFVHTLQALLPSCTLLCFVFNIMYTCSKSVSCATKIMKANCTKPYSNSDELASSVLLLLTMMLAAVVSVSHAAVVTTAGGTTHKTFPYHLIVIIFVAVVTFAASVA